MQSALNTIKSICIAHKYIINYTEYSIQLSLNFKYSFLYETTGMNKNPNRLTRAIISPYWSSTLALFKTLLGTCIKHFILLHIYFLKGSQIFFDLSWFWAFVHNAFYPQKSSHKCSIWLLIALLWPIEHSAIRNVNRFQQTL